MEFMVFALAADASFGPALHAGSAARVANEAATDAINRVTKPETIAVLRVAAVLRGRSYSRDRPSPRCTRKAAAMDLPPRIFLDGLKSLRNAPRRRMTSAICTLLRATAVRDEVGR